MKRTKKTYKKQTPQLAIRRHCVNCQGSSYEVLACGGDRLLNKDDGLNGTCLFFPYRLGKGRPSVKLIRKFCINCMGGNKTLVKECPSTDCEVWIYRMGTNPARAGMGDITRLKGPFTGENET